MFREMRGKMTRSVRTARPGAAAPPVGRFAKPGGQGIEISLLTLDFLFVILLI